MNKGAKVISQSIIGNDFRTIIVNKKGYTIYPPTIHSLSNAISYLCDVREGETLRGEDGTQPSETLSIL